MILSTAALARKVLKVSLNADNQGKFVSSLPIVSDCPTVLRPRSTRKKRMGQYKQGMMLTPLQISHRNT